MKIGGDTMLEGFKVINLTVGLPTISVTQNGVAFNKTTISKLEHPEYVLLMINTKDKKLAVQVCEEQTEGATPFYKQKRNDNVVSVRWNNKDLLNTIAKTMDWDLSNGYRIVGDFLEDDKAMIFDLTKAEIIT